MDADRVIFRCENNTDGIFTGIYDAWDSRLGHSKVALQVNENDNMELFCTYVQVKTDSEKAEKVAGTLKRKLHEEDYEVIFQASLSRHPEKADALYRTVVKGLHRSHTQPITRNLADPDICKVFECARQVGHEAHRYTGFIRFQELKNKILFSKIEPMDQVLPLIGDHFADRFPMENFVIFDERHQMFLVHEAGRPWMLASGHAWNSDVLKELSESERDFQNWWKCFCESVAIKERMNSRLQMQNLPLRFRANLIPDECVKM